MAELTQNQKVLNHLKNEGAITSMMAFSKYSITRLAARVKDLRDQGHEIESEMVYASGSVKYAKYTLEN